MTINGENKHALYFASLPLPPSTNHLYFTSPYGGRSLTALAKVYKQDIQDTVIRTMMQCRAEPLENTPYGLRLVFYMKGLLTKTKGAKHRFNKVDLDNRQKVLIDALVAGFGIDDRCLFQIESRKVVFDLRGEEGYVSVYLYPLVEESIFESSAADAWVRRLDQDERVEETR